MRIINSNSNLSAGLLKSSKKSISSAFNETTDLTNYCLALFHQFHSLSCINYCPFHFHPGKSGIWFPPQGSCLYICRINGEARGEVSTWLYRFPGCRRMVLVANFEYHQKCFESIDRKRWPCQVPGLWPFEISGVRCTDGGRPQDLPNY